MIPVVSAIIYAVMGASAAGIATAYWYERKLRKDAYNVNESLSVDLRRADSEIRSLRMELARLEGISQGRECDAMQRKFLESMQQNGQSVVKLRAQRRETQ